MWLQERFAVNDSPHDDAFERAVAASWTATAWSDLTVLVAVSGGADSVALLRALHRLKTGGRGRLVVGHFNHAWRGEESDADERFVHDLAAELGLPCESARGEPPASSASGEGAESIARRDRYAFLQATAEHCGARYIATAHTADDQAETVLHRILRGTSVAGLSGMPRVRQLGSWTTLIRPLLSLRRSEVLAYLERIRQPFRSDLSNLDLSFMRNRIRHELLPLLAKRYNASVTEALLRLSSLAAEGQQVVAAVIEPLYDQAVEVLPDGSLRIDCHLLADQPRHVVREIGVLAWRKHDWPRGQMGLAQWDQLADALLAPGVETPRWLMFPGNLQLERRADDCRLRPLDAPWKSDP
jgi:tRNA(Ile)-lysidine synthase